MSPERSTSDIDGHEPPSNVNSYVEKARVTVATTNNLFEVPKTVKSENYTVKKTYEPILVQNDPEAILLVMNPPIMLIHMWKWPWCQSRPPITCLSCRKQ